ncbi:MAG TPA: isoaspartyl peptidase/L-asparaginase [Candidatus Norongarragalinales archaeon]|nr:isoaspartyl peptidase/L-asparaginase [Candidatus Norongarragalinales archaeon]
MPKPALVIHGGAWAIEHTTVDDHKKGLQNALEVGWKILNSGGPALDAIEKTINSMEDSGVFDAGKGCVLNEKGEVEMDAMVMTGDLLAGAVAALQEFPNPISVARRVMEKTQHMLLVGKGAAIFAEKQGFERMHIMDLVSHREFRSWKDNKEMPFGTVGAVALDKQGGLAQGTSTGGTRGKMVGRVGDSPLIGAGGYCDSDTGGASTTGHGESFMKILACKTACDYLRTEKSAQLAAEKTIKLMEIRTSGKVGIILLGKDGDIGIAFNTARMARGFAREGDLQVFV